MKSTALDARLRTDDATSQTDDLRIKDITVLPPPEHLIRFFPIQGSEIEGLVADTRRKVRDIVHGRSDRLIVIIATVTGAMVYSVYQKKPNIPRDIKD